MTMLPYGHQWIDDKDINEVTNTLQSAWLTQGPKIKIFEDVLCSYTGTKYAVCVSSGTAALHIACLAAGVKPYDEVITSPITFVASANCVIYCGGKPVFADIQADTANINPENIKGKLNSRTKAIIPVHYAGHPCNLKEISTIAKKHNLIVIEDAAHALGAEYNNHKIGSCRYSDMTILSFHPVKHITTGEGGAILTNNKGFYNKLLMLRNHGITKQGFVNKAEGDWYYEMQFLGFNYRLTEIQASLGISQMKKLNMFLKRRRKIAHIYQSEFEGNPYFDLPIERSGTRSAYHIYTIKLKDQWISKKSHVFRRLREEGLGVQVHYLPVYLHPFYKNLGYRQGACPTAEDFYQREISIPIYPSMSVQDIKYVIKKTFKVFSGLN